MKRAREAAGLTLADVSRRCGIDQPALSRLESGDNKNPTLDTLWRYAAAVGRRLVLTTEAIGDTRPARGKTKPVRPAQQRKAAVLIRLSTGVTDRVLGMAGQAKEAWIRPVVF
jgi:transcriptional regulator with XRE-family HTH domain